MSMSRKKPRGRKKKRKATPGSFKPGPDRRRHVFTTSECRIGYWVAAIKHPELREWLTMRIRVYYHERSKHGKENERGVDCHAGPACRKATDNDCRDADISF